jgi:hypothetical protein
VELYLHYPRAPSWRGAEFKHMDNFTSHNEEVTTEIMHLSYTGQAVSNFGHGKLRSSWIYSVLQANSGAIYRERSRQSPSISSLLTIHDKTPKSF